MSSDDTARAAGVAAATRVLLADDHDLVRAGLRLLLDAEPDLEVVSEAADGDEALRRGLEDDLDLALLDIRMPHRSGLSVAMVLREQRPQLRTIILSMYDNQRYVQEARRAGASAYVLKSAAARELVPACRAAMRGDAHL